MKEQQDEDDDQVIIDEEKPLQFLEHNYQSAYKLKSMKLMQLVPGQGWKNIMEIKDLYMAKIAYNPECNKIYVIGGAKDQRSKQTVN